MSTLTAHEIASALHDISSVLVRSIGYEGHRLYINGQQEDVYVVAVTDFDYAHHALLYLFDSKSYIGAAWNASDDLTVEWLGQGQEWSWSEALIEWARWVSTTEML